MKKQNKIEKVLKQLKQSEDELGKYCISQAAEALKTSGYKDSHLWATTILSAIMGDFGYIEDETDIADLAMELEGAERDVLESLYDAFEYITNSTDADPSDVRDTLVYAISKVLDEADKKKYKGLYG